MKARGKYVVVDTNVPKVANLALQAKSDEGVPHECIMNCVRAIKGVMQKNCLVIDAEGEILKEYRRQMSPDKSRAAGKQTGVGDLFVKWAVENCHWGEIDTALVQRVAITREGDSYREFPCDPGLENFDISDRKFVAVSHAHKKKPPILQATDSKWWGWKDALKKVGIEVKFLCPEYIQAKFRKKIGE